MYIGNFAAAQTIRKAFNTEDGAGNAVTLLGSPTVAVYKDGNLTQVTTGTTLTVDYDSVTGLNMLIIDTSSDGTFYASGSDYKVVLSAGTVAGVSVVGKVLAEFSISNRTPNPATIADAVWDELLNTGHETDNSAADILRTAETAIQNVKTDVDAYLDAPVSEAIGANTVTADRVAKQQTFYLGSEGNVARNIVTLNDWSSGTRTIGFDFSELLDQADTRINSVSAVTVVQADGSPSITTSNLRKHQNGKVAIWDTAAISAANAGTYVVTVTITTLDSNTIVVTGTLEVE